MESTIEREYISRLELQRFTAFNSLEIDFSPGINIFIGENETGKTHILKVLYSACDIVKPSPKETGFSEKILRVFRPSEKKIGRLVHRRVGRERAIIKIYRGNNYVKTEFSSNKQNASRDQDQNLNSWKSHKFSTVYIPVKEMLAHAPGFLSLYNEHDIAFEEVYPDLISKANIPLHKGPRDKKIAKYIKILKKSIHGRVYIKNEEFVLSREKVGHIEFTLLAEGIRKLALLLQLILNGTLLSGSVLFWDEPEANLNPSMLDTVVEVLLELQREGVQIFLATHNYILLKKFDQKKKETDQVKFFSLERDKTNYEITYKSGGSYIDILPNKISEAYESILKYEVDKILGGLS